MRQAPLFEPETVGITRTTLTRLLAEIARSLARIGKVAVEGEVVKPIARPSGWVYFTLADRSARLAVACPGARARRFAGIENGARVLVTGTVVFTTRSSQLHLEAAEVVPVGAGAIEAAIARTREVLRGEGILDRPRRPIPVLPAAVGVICGTEAAVIGDIESVVADRFPGYPLVFRTVTVSGPGAADAIVGALDHLANRPEVEVVVVARGGGDPAALFPFSDEEVCRRIASMPVPVVTAIGHERDHPLCDEVSDLACNTPSLAAMRVVPDEVGLRGASAALVAGAAEHLGSSLSARRSELARSEPAGLLSARVAAARDRLEWMEPVGLVEARWASTLERLGWIDLTGGLRSRVVQAAQVVAHGDVTGVLAPLLTSATSRISGLTATLDALDPARILGRGYAIVTSRSGSLVRSVRDVVEGDRLHVTVADGSFGAVVSDGEDR